MKLLFVSAFLVGVVFAGVVIEKNDESLVVAHESESNNETLIPVEVIHDDPEDELRTLSSLISKRKKKPDHDDDHHHRDRDKLVIQIKPTEPPYVPRCPNPHVEEWVYSYDCDVQCDHQGVIDSEYFDGVSGFYRSSKSHRCRRMVSDVLWEEGYKNITRREDLGYPPETQEEYLRRTKKNLDSHYYQSNPDYVVVQGDNHYHRPPGSCVCRRGYARLRGKCVPIEECPKLNCNLSTQKYVACAPCPKTCATLLTYDYTALGCSCSPRCVCRFGLIISPNGDCIRPEDCAQFLPA